MKKILIILLAAVFVFQIGIFPVFAGTSEEEERITAFGYTPPSSAAEEETEDIYPDKEKNVSEEQSIPEEWVFSGDDIDVLGGKYSYELVIRADKTLVFENDLEISYHGIEGRYQLYYEIEEDGNHIMIVTGEFENIITASPLLDLLTEESKNQLVSRIGGDTYFYQLNLRTKEGFSYTNILKFYFDLELHGYSIDFDYDLLTDHCTIAINKIAEADE